MKRIRAFTLIELLTVIAITAVLMTLIVLPLFQSFQVLRQGQALADAQDKGRFLVERIAREVGNAITVRSGAGSVTTTVNGDNNVGVSTTSLVITVPQKGGGFAETVLREAKMDLVPPAQGTIELDANGNPVFRDPITGKIDPTLTRPKGDINLSPRPGATIVRWWIGLNRAVGDDGQAVPYNEPYTGLLMNRTGSRDNLYVLRRAEIQPYLPGGAVNTKYFRADASGRRILDMDDPRFFLPDASDAGKNQRVLAWQQASVVQTELSRYDMIRPVTTGSPATPVVTYDAATGTIPQVLPLIQFRPTRVASSPAAGSAAARPGEAVDGLDRIGPETFQTDRGLWSNAIVRYYPSGYAPTDPNLSSFEVAGVSSAGASVIRAGQASLSGADAAIGQDLFSLTAYEQAIATATTPGATYLPFSAAIANNSAWLGDDGSRAQFTPFRVLPSTGKIVTSFPIDQVGRPYIVNGQQVPNLPSFEVKRVTTPPQNPGSGAALSPRTQNYEPNLAFNRIFNGDPDGTGMARQNALQGFAQRFLDLRMIPNADGTPSPLYPVPMAGQITGFNSIVQTSQADGSTTRIDSGGRMNRVRIVPGSEAVFGPDQTTTGGYGNIVRYTRVAKNPGPNQYTLVYVDQPEPTNTSGKVDYSAYGLDTTGFDPTTYDPTNIISAVIQPRFKAGYLQFDSDPNVPLPTGLISVSYRFQFNGPGDTFAVDYDTREVMQILLTIKNYPQSSAPNPQVVTLTSTATLRNALR